MRPNPSLPDGMTAADYRAMDGIPEPPSRANGWLGLDDEPPEPEYDGSVDLPWPDNARLVASQAQLYALAGADAIIQPKFDGWRCMFHAGGTDGENYTAYSRRHKVIELPEPVWDALHELPYGIAGLLLDGELLGTHRQAGTEPCYVVFDCLYSDGSWMGRTPYTARLELVAELLAPISDAHLMVCPTLREIDVDEALRDSRVEGLVAKRPQSFLVGGRDRAAVNPEWFKWRAKQ